MSTAIAAKTRPAFSMNRQAEFFSESELVKQLGHPRQYWHAVLVAELVDNALDACEEENILPKIVIDVCDDSITVTDNGPGIPMAIIESMTDFSTRTSSRIRRAAPTRGAQGNALLCVTALPYVANGSQGIIEIDSGETCHRIVTVMDSIAGRPVIEREKTPGKVQIGTSFRVQLPCQPEVAGIQRIVPMIATYAAFNPHAEFTVMQYGGGFRWQSSSEKINKWTARNAEPVHWHDQESFRQLVAASIQLDRADGNSRLVRDYVQQFAGLKRSQSAKDVLDATGLARARLGDLIRGKEIDSAKVDSLFQAMRDASDAPPIAKLGSIGKVHIEKSFDGKVKHRCKKGTTSNGLPFVLEVAFRDREDDGNRRLYTGVNFSADVVSPALECIYSLLAEAMIRVDSPVDVFVHLTTPRPVYSDRGKTKIDLDREILPLLDETLIWATKEYTAKMKAAERDASKAIRDRERQNRQNKEEVTLKDAIFEVMDESIDIVSQDDTCDFSARNHYYAIRPLVQEYCSTPLTQKYLDKVIDEYEEEFGIIERRTRDPRGFLLEPHTETRVPLGTREVDNYTVPLNLYHTVIYVEKKGLLSLFEYGKIAERYDAAIICAEGFAVRAAQSLMQAAAKGHKMKILVFHDADPSGYGIANAIGAKSGAHDFNFEIIDAGLKLEEAIAMELAPEAFTRKKALGSGLILTPTEERLFGGERQTVTGKNGKPCYEWINCKRVELNALAAYPDRFIAWVEEKLGEHGVKSKLIPSKKVIIDKTTNIYSGLRQQAIGDAVVAAFGVASIVDAIDAKLAKPSFSNAYQRLRTWGKKMEPRSWTVPCQAIATKSLQSLKDEINREAAKAASDRRTD